MRGKIVNLLLGLANIAFGVLLYIFTSRVPQNSLELTLQAQIVVGNIKVAIYYLMAVVVCVNMIQYYNHRKDTFFNAAYLIGVFCISFIFIKAPFVAVFNVLSGRLSIDSIKKYYHFYLVSILTTGLYNLTYVLEKYYMFFKYIKSYEILFLEGIIELFLSIVTLIITTNIGYIDNFWDYWENLDGNEIVIFFVLTLIYFLDYTLILSVLDIFTPFHVFLITIVSEIILFFYNIDKMNIIVAILSFILLILDTFMILVFIELLELNFCDLSKMTGKNIELRARIDSLNDDKIFDKEVTFGEYELEIKDDQETETDLTERGTIN